MFSRKARTGAVGQLHATLEPLRLANVLREAQAGVAVDHSLAVTLDLDHHIHVAVDGLLLSWVLENLLERAAATALLEAQIVLACRSEEAGVVIELEYEVDRQRSYRQSRADWLALVLPAIPAELREHAAGERCVMQLCLPSNLYRTYAPPAPSDE